MMEELYQEIILDHYRRPRNKGKAEPSDISAHDSNPLCGDEIDVTAKLVGHKIVELKFDGKGCAICTASASIMTQKLVGKTLAEARQFINGFLNMMRGETPFGGKEMGDLKALEGVLKFPVRVKCATLAWNTAQQGIQEREAKKQ
jgi:nitrogen fixation protein NifU and related proteins